MGFNSGFKGLKVSNDLTIAMVFAVTDRGKYHRNAQRRKPRALGKTQNWYTRIQVKNIVAAELR
jgi:hypothetical protein